MVTETTKSLAGLTAVVGFSALAALILMFAGLRPLGPVNDVLGAVTAVLVLLLAVASRDLLPASSTVRGLALGAAALGATLAVLGSVLVLTGRTGWYRAGLVSSFGWGWIGVWFLAVALTVLATGSGPGWLRWVGVVAAALMVVGLAVLPGVISGIDDWDSAGPGLVVPQALSYLGSLLLLVWCIGVGRSGG